MDSIVEDDNIIDNIVAIEKDAILIISCLRNSNPKNGRKRVSNKAKAKGIPTRLFLLGPVKKLRRSPPELASKPKKIDMSVALLFFTAISVYVFNLQ